MGLFDVVTFPFRVAVAFGEASIGVAKLVDPQGPTRFANQVSDLTAEDRPLGKALAPGGIVDRVLEEDGVLARLTAPGGALDRMIEPGGPVDRIMAPNGPVDRLLAQEGAIDRMLEEGGIIDRLLAKEGLIEQLVAEDGILDKLSDVMETIAKIGPVIESMDRPIKAIDESAQVLSVAVEPLKDLAMKMPGIRRRPTPTVRTVSSEREDIVIEVDDAEIVEE